MRRIPAIIDAAPDLEVLVGGDDWALEGFAAGATGWVTGVGRRRAAPSASSSTSAAAPASSSAARAVYRRLLPLARFDMTPKLVPVLQGGRMDAVGLRRRRRAPAAAAAHRRRARRRSAPRSRVLRAALVA